MVREGRETEGKEKGRKVETPSIICCVRPWSEHSKQYTILRAIIIFIFL